MSSRMMALAAEYAPRQEIYSIDECFLDFSGVSGDLLAAGRALRAKVLKWIGLPTSVGFGATKTLAKLANHVAKTADRKPGSYPRELAQVCSFGDLAPPQLEAVMAGTEAGAVWGIGPKTAERLQAMGIRTVLDLLRSDPTNLRRQFSVAVEKTVQELRGVSCMDVDDAPAANQQIMCSRSFGAPVTELPELIEVVSQFTGQVARKLREQGSVARAVHVFVATSPYRQNDRQHAPSATLPLPRPTADTRELVSASVRALRGIYRPGFNYAKAGVMLVDLQAREQESENPDLFGFDPEPPGSSPGRTGLMNALDALNQRYGRNAVTVGTAARRSGPNPHASKQERRSPRCTTRLDEIVTARA